MGTIAFLAQLLLLGLGIFLMIVILLQRGRGGGLAGAFGGLGGQSAFGTKAGDVFTKITIVMAVAWVVVAGGSGYFLRAVDKGTRAADLGNVSEDKSAEEAGASFDTGLPDKSDTTPSSTESATTESSTSEGASAPPPKAEQTPASDAAPASDNNTDATKPDADDASETNSAAETNTQPNVEPPGKEAAPEKSDE